MHKYIFVIAGLLALLYGCKKDDENPDSFGTFTYGDRIYAFKTIGTQTWMIENLAYLPQVSPTNAGSETQKHHYVYGYEGTSVSAAKASYYYIRYGVLYNYEAAKDACPPGWHLPSDEEWTIFRDYLTNNGFGYEGSGSDIAKSLVCTFGWQISSTSGTAGNIQSTNNRSGFNVVPAGRYTYGSGFDYLGEVSYLWSSSGFGQALAYVRHLTYDRDSLSRGNRYRKDGLSVRCLKD